MIELRSTYYHQKVSNQNVLINYNIQYVFFIFYYQSFTPNVTELNEISFHNIIYWMTLHINTSRIYLQIVTSRVVADEGIHNFI